VTATIFGAADRAYALTPTAVKTASTAAAANQYLPLDTTSGAITVTLPAAPPDRTVVGVRIVKQGSTNPSGATIAAAGADVFNLPSGPTSRTLALVNSGAWWQYAAASGIWHEVADDLPLTGLDQRYGQLYNILIYGADPTGTVDSYAAIQAAINAAQTAGSGTVFIPGGTYLVSSAPQITGTGIVVRGNGWASVIKLGSAALNGAGTTIGLWVNGGTNILIEDLTVDGNAANVARDGGQVVASTLLGSSALGAAVATAPAAGTTETWTVNAAAATATTGYIGIPFVFKVDSEWALCTGGQGTTSWTVRRGFESTSTATHSNGASLANTNGTLFDATITRYGVNSPKSYMSSFYAGGIDATTYLQYRMPIRISNAANVTVKGCLLQNSISGGIVVNSSSVNGCTDIQVTNNRIKLTWDNGVYFHQGIQYATAALNHISDTMYNGVSMVYSDHVIVTGNNIRLAGPSFSDSGGVQINGSSNCEVTGNIIDACQFEGVNVLSSQETNITGGAGGNQVWSGNAVVANNQITGCQAADFPTHTSAGVNVFGGDDTNITGNSIDNCDYGVSMGSKATRTQVINNRITRSRSLGINVGNSADVVGTTIKSCFVGYGLSHGIYVNAPARIEGCTVVANGSGGNGMGINLSSPPAGIPNKVDWVLGNTIIGNIDSGVYANAGTGNVAIVQGNTFGNDQAVIFGDGSVTFGNAALNSATAAFTTADVNLPVVLMDQGSGGVTTATTVSAYVSSTQIAMAATAQATETGVSFWIGRGPATFTDGATTNVANSVLTSATANFGSTDAGKTIVLMSQSPTPQVLFAGTIGSVTNSTTAVLSGAAGAIAACTLVINRSAGQQVRAINNGSGICIDRNNTAWGIPEILTGGTTYNLQAVDRTAVYDASVTLDTTARAVAVVGLTAARTITLPDATKYPPAVPLFIKDETGACSGAKPILLATQGGQTVDGATAAAISTPYGDATLYASGAQWFTRAPVPVLNYDPDAPGDRGWAEWNFAIMSAGANGTQAFVSGSVYGASFVARTGKTISAVGYNASALAVTPTAGENLIGLYGVSGTTWTQLAVTGDLGTWTATNVAQFANLGSSVALQPGATYAALALSVAATPVVLRGVSGASGSWLNAGLGNGGTPWMKFFVYGTAQTALPASFTAGAGTMSGTGALAPWFAFK
jgi:hypothetical protein